MDHSAPRREHGAHGTSGGAYGRLLAMSAVSFIAMYALMYAMVDRLANAVSNFNQVYMAGLMTAAMVIIELVVMRGMYRNTRLNAALLIGGLAALVLFYSAIRRQTAIDDRQFLRSMIPHHAGAILMCEQASISDPEIRKLCAGIVRAQEREIAQMRDKLRELSGRR